MLRIIKLMNNAIRYTIKFLRKGLKLLSNFEIMELVAIAFALFIVYGAIISDSGLMIQINYYTQLSLDILKIVAVIVAISVPSIYFLIKKFKENNYKKSEIGIIDSMSGIEFEKFLIVFFTKQGYKAEITKTSGDFGADLILSKDGVKTIVQAKRYSKSVGVKAIQEIIGAKKYYSAQKLIVITNNYFSRQAKELAKVNNVQLIDRDQLIQQLKLTQS